MQNLFVSPSYHYIFFYVYYSLDQMKLVNSYIKLMNIPMEYQRLLESY